MEDEGLHISMFVEWMKFDERRMEVQVNSLKGSREGLSLLLLIIKKQYISYCHLFQKSQVSSFLSWAAETDFPSTANQKTKCGY